MNDGFEDMEGAERSLTQAQTAGRGQNNSRLGYRFAKRTFDIVFSSAVIVIGFIPGALLSIAISRDTGGSPFYSQIRVGRGGKPFKLLKFRTMVADADDLEKYLTPEQLDMWHREHKVDEDPRITKLGYVLRKLSVDEFPQFVNVLLGQISTIGPRAITFEELEQYGNQKTELLSVPPGITGAWQIGDRNAATFENGKRQAIELEYVQNATIATDMAIFFSTFGVMFVKRNGK